MIIKNKIEKLPIDTFRSPKHFVKQCKKNYYLFTLLDVKVWKSNLDQKSNINVF